ncbi:putative Acyltransferase 3 domain-containing protein [Seiridium cardinale]|uniref:Acyltransferase 3 domain-containing protein n=1 Tax=Seiridium cardinale TaxID=138064 RepID=A0ABR2XJM2_9PEZI
MTKVQPRRYCELARAILPSFACDWMQPGRQRPRKLHATSYLDGLRGLAALAVFGYHFTDYNLKYFHPGYGVQESSSLLQLPFVRLIYAGKPMVHLFFVISGFALSLRPLQELHALKIEECRATLASSLFRRPIRLWGPCLVLTFSLVFWARFGFFLHYIDYQPTLEGQILDWSSDFFHRISWPWSWDFGERPRYNVHLWTIPIEFSHSCLLFLVMLLLSHLRSSLRVATIVAIMAYTMRCGRWAAFEFLGGCLLAHMPTNQPKSSEEFENPRQGLRNAGFRVLNNFLHVALLLTGTFIMSWPTDFAPLPSTYSYLVLQTPRPFTNKSAPDFWFALAAVVVVWSVGQLKCLRRVLELPVPQYLGRISFSFYILQHPFLNLLQSWIMGAEPRAAQQEQPAVPGWGLRLWPGVHTWPQQTSTPVIMVAFISATLVALTATVANALPGATAADMIERQITNNNGTTSTILVNRDVYKISTEATREASPLQEFFKTDTYEAYCAYNDDSDHTNDASPYVEDCTYILNYFRYQFRGFWDLSRLVAGEDYAIVTHNTCSLYYRVESGHDSAQLASADFGGFVNSTINKYKQSFGNNSFSRVEATGNLRCYESDDGVTNVVTTLSLRH